MAFSFSPGCLPAGRSPGGCLPATTCCRFLPPAWVGFCLPACCLWMDAVLDSACVLPACLLRIPAVHLRLPAVSFLLPVLPAAPAACRLPFVLFLPAWVGCRSLTDAPSYLEISWSLEVGCISLCSLGRRFLPPPLWVLLLHSAWVVSLGPVHFVHLPGSPLPAWVGGMEISAWLWVLPGHLPGYRPAACLDTALPACLPPARFWVDFCLLTPGHSIYRCLPIGTGHMNNLDGLLYMFFFLLYIPYYGSTACYTPFCLLCCFVTTACCRSAAVPGFLPGYVLDCCVLHLLPAGILLCACVSLLLDACRTCACRSGLLSFTCRFLHRLPPLPACTPGFCNSATACLRVRFCCCLPAVSAPAAVLPAWIFCRSGTWTLLPAAFSGISGWSPGHCLMDYMILWIFCVLLPAHIPYRLFFACGFTILGFVTCTTTVSACLGLLYTWFGFSCCVSRTWVTCLLRFCFWVTLPLPPGFLPFVLDACLYLHGCLPACLAAFTRFCWIGSWLPGIAAWAGCLPPGAPAPRHLGCFWFWNAYLPGFSTLYHLQPAATLWVSRFRFSATCVLHWVDSGTFYRLLLTTAPAMGATAFYMMPAPAVYRVLPAVLPFYLPAWVLGCVSGLPCRSAWTPAVSFPAVSAMPLGFRLPAWVCVLPGFCRALAGLGACLDACRFAPGWVLPAAFLPLGFACCRFWFTAWVCLPAHACLHIYCRVPLTCCRSGRSAASLLLVSGFLHLPAVLPACRYIGLVRRSAVLVAHCTLHCLDFWTCLLDFLEQITVFTTAVAFPAARLLLPAACGIFCLLVSRFVPACCCLDSAD